MFHAPTGCSTYRTTYRRVFHGDALSRGRHRLRGRWEYSNRNGPNDPNGPNGPNGPSSLSSLSNPGNRSNLSRCNNPGSPSNQ